MQLKFYAILLVAVLLAVGCTDDPASGAGESSAAADYVDSDLEQQAAELARGKRCGGPFKLRCGSGEVCSISSSDGSCPSPTAYGMCQPQRLCPQIFDPVCGCNGKTFSNACSAAVAGVAVRSDGACPPSDGPACGGFAGIACPGEGSCVDDPRDDCDPNNGGADCGGLCVCSDPHSCPLGSRFDARPSVCACVRDTKLCPTAPCTFTDCAAGLRCVERDCQAVCEPIGGCAPCPKGELCTDVCVPLPTPIE